MGIRTLQEQGLADKVAWILPGGGGRAAITAGEIYASRKSAIPRPNFIVAGSGGAGTASYLKSEQYDSIKNIWCNLVPEKKFVNPWHFWRFMNVDYLVDVIFRKLDPLDLDKFNNSVIPLYIGTTERKGGDVLFVKANKENLWKLLKATKSTPFFSGLKCHAPFIQDKQYFDSRYSANWQTMLDFAIEKGATKVFIFGNYEPKGSERARRLYRIYLFFKKKDFREKHKNSLNNERTYKITSDVNVAHIYPSTDFNPKPWDNSRNTIESLFRAGEKEINNLAYSQENTKI